MTVALLPALGLNLTFMTDRGPTHGVPLAWRRMWVGTGVVDLMSTVPLATRVIATVTTRPPSFVLIRNAEASAARAPSDSPLRGLSRIICGSRKFSSLIPLLTASADFLPTEVALSDLPT